MAAKTQSAPANASGANQQQNPVAINAAARRSLIPGPNTQTVKRIQQIASITAANYTAGQQVVLNISPAPVGIITRFIVEVTAAIGIGAAETQTRVQNGASAFFSNVQYIDTSNQTRINCPSWYLHHLASIRRRQYWNGVAVNDINGVAGLGANWSSGIAAAPASLTAAPGAANFKMFFEVPLAYGNDDLRGAVLASLINATQQLNLTINPNFFVTSTDQVNVAESAYQSSSAQLGKIGSYTVTVYQEYIDQFGGLALPQIDLATQYLLQTSGGYNPVANTDLIIPYANFRLFMSTIVRYNNSGVFNAGSDTNYLAIRTANQSDLIHVDPYAATLLAREHVDIDLPTGYYLLNHRQKPLFTNAFGNLSLVFQANSVSGVNSSVLVAYEQLALMNQLPAASAIGSGG